MSDHRRAVLPLFSRTEAVLTFVCSVALIALFVAWGVTSDGWERVIGIALAVGIAATAIVSAFGRQGAVIIDGSQVCRRIGPTGRVYGCSDLSAIVHITVRHRHTVPRGVHWIVLWARRPADGIPLWLQGAPPRPFEGSIYEGLDEWAAQGVHPLAIPVARLRPEHRNTLYQFVAGAEVPFDPEGDR